MYPYDNDPRQYGPRGPFGVLPYAGNDPRQYGTAGPFGPQAGAPDVPLPPPRPPGTTLTSTPDPAAGSFNKGWGTPSQAVPQMVPPDPNAPATPATAANPALSPFAQAKADIGAGSYGKAFGDIFGNDKIMGSLSSAAQNIAGSQGSGSPQAVPAAPMLDTNQASIAQQAPQLMATLAGKRRKTPGLSLSGVNYGNLG